MGRKKTKKDVPLTQEEKELLEKNLPLVWWEAHRQNPRNGHEASEWIQEGVFGAIRAIQSYNPDRGELSTWIVFNVRNYILSFRRERSGVIALPRDLLTESTREHARRSRRLIPIYKRDRLKKAFISIAEEIEPEEDYNLSYARSRLGEEDRRYIHLRFDRGLGLKEIGEMYGFSRQHASTKVSEAVGRLRREYARLEGIDIQV